MYVLNEFLTADRSCTTKYFLKTSREVGSSHLYAFFLAPFESKLVKYSRQSESLKMLENGKMDVFEEKCRRFRILPKI